MLSAQSVLRGLEDELQQNYPGLVTVVDQGEEGEESDSWYLWISLSEVEMLIVELTGEGDFVFSRFLEADEDSSETFLGGPDAYGLVYGATAAAIERYWS